MSDPQPSVQPGALVRLKSGGPVMTVEGVRDNGVVVCLWHNDHGVQTYAHQPWVLEVVQPPRSYRTDVEEAWQDTTAYVQRVVDAWRDRETQEQEKQS
jgi:uncharacterized protein YodC (DUF2158 family)